MELKVTEAGYFKERILKWGRKNFADFPWRHVKNRWHSIAAEVMLQRTRAEQVVPVFLDFCAKYPTPAAFLKNNRENIFASLGLIWREKVFRKLAEALSEQDIPEDRVSLMKLPGVGDYIASAYRSLHISKKDTIIDSNVVRIYGRFFGFETDGETRRKRWFIELAERITPGRNFKDYNYGLIDFTREICRPKPKCEICVLRRKCKYFRW